MSENTVTLGIDVGYSHTKTVTMNKKTGTVRDVFKSTVREGAIDINNKSIVIGYEGKEYTVGESGSRSTDSNKIYDWKFEIFLITAILRNVDEDMKTVNVNLVTGLPVAYYQKQKDELIQSLKNKKMTVEYKGKERKIQIKEVIVFPQSAGVVLLHPDKFKEGETNLVIDMGGYTVDVSYFVGRKIQEGFQSYKLGMNLFYTHLQGKLSQEFNIDVELDDVERFIEQGGVTLNEELHTFNFDKEFNDWMEKILGRIKNGFPYDTVHRKNFVGGGSLRFKDYLPNNKGVEVDEIMANAEAFYMVGVNKFE